MTTLTTLASGYTFRGKLTYLFLTSGAFHFPHANFELSRMHSGFPKARSAVRSVLTMPGDHLFGTRAGQIGASLESEILQGKSYNSPFSPRTTACLEDKQNTRDFHLTFTGSPDYSKSCIIFSLFPTRLFLALKSYHHWHRCIYH